MLGCRVTPLYMCYFQLQLFTGRRKQPNKWYMTLIMHAATNIV